MRQLRQIELDRLQLLTEHNVEFTLIEPTATGLTKSIMDATGPVRTYLKTQGVHDFNLQAQGQEHKLLVQAKLLGAFSESHSTVSLYRPITKKGDPRIWFTGLKRYVEANDILGIIHFEGTLYVINVAQLDLRQLIQGELHNPIKELVSQINRDANAIANELLFRLRGIAAMGPVAALLQADTAVGRTLETLLDIPINSRRAPDYKGIELKSFRATKGAKKTNNRKTLFAQVPDWQFSKFKSSAQILDAFGYMRNGKFRLNCTVSTLGCNSQGLQLKLNGSLGRLVENSARAEIGDFATWAIDSLHQTLLSKHNETFWIAADSIHENGQEYLHYKNAAHTRKPITSQFDILLEQGLITLDHLISRHDDGKVKEHGPLFKIHPRALSLLFPPSLSYDLLV
ncbi:MvaI/BcnI family restriction endonuclease [Parapedobacter tibetensis]|uniref:MvaI/BcnI family restriction endonuclease n=1 Tax=Parapedobacter tibetensis TaxID=2972951 RepID=UPI00214D2ACD|nr:MvaI/BcnI family restriction endonuclease [Parapedobacter tibetensis]